jgi:small subunit ribosomal protein S13
MARIAGVEMPPNKPIWVGLTYIFGIGRATSLQLLRKVEVPPETRAKGLADVQVARINDLVEKTMTVEGPLRRLVTQNIQRLREIRCYRGIRHMKGLPVRGQKTRSNARTRKGPRKTVAGKKQVKRMS